MDVVPGWNVPFKIFKQALSDSLGQCAATFEMYVDGGG